MLLYPYVCSDMLEVVTGDSGLDIYAKTTKSTPQFDSSKPLLHRAMVNHTSRMFMTAFGFSMASPNLDLTLP